MRQKINDLEVNAGSGLHVMVGTLTEQHGQDAIQPSDISGE